MPQELSLVFRALQDKMHPMYLSSEAIMVVFILGALLPIVVVPLVERGKSKEKWHDIWCFQIAGVIIASYLTSSIFAPGYPASIVILSIWMMLGAALSSLFAGYVQKAVSSTGK